MKVTESEVRAFIRQEAKRIISERTEGVVEHDDRFEQLLQTLAALMNEYQMDPKAIANLAARRIYERLPKPPWVNDADAHTLRGDDEKKAKGPDDAAGKTPAPKGGATDKKDGKNSGEELEETAPPGWEGTVKSMKKHKDIKNPFALAWSMKDKGKHPHK